MTKVECPKCKDTGIIRRVRFRTRYLWTCDCSAGEREALKPNLRPMCYEVTQEEIDRCYKDEVL